MTNKRGRQSQQSLWDRIWKDKEGNVVIWQMPNWPLWVWVGFTLLSLFFSGSVADIFSWIASAALIVWSLMEIFKGVNYFRRAMGLLVMYFSVMTVIKLITG